MRLHLNREKLDLRQTFLDVGREDVPFNSGTYLWRSSCLQSWVTSFDSRGTGQKGSLFSWCSTTNASQATVELRMSNPLRKGGLLYAQRYNVDKEWLDSMGTYPFSHKAVEAFLVAPHRLELWSRAAGTPHQFTWETCKEIWLASRSRVNDAVRDAEGASVDVRQEYRIRWDLYQLLNTDLRAVHNPMHCFWAVKTSDALVFRRWDLNRWLCLIEYLRSWIRPEDLAQEDMVTEL